jgi:hypothetical protein
VGLGQADVADREGAHTRAAQLGRLAAKDERAHRETEPHRTKEVGIEGLLLSAQSLVE